MKVNADYTSVWDGGYEVTTGCEVDLNTGLIHIESADADEVEVLDREYMEFNHREFEVEYRAGDYYVVDLGALKAEVLAAV